jgi:lipid II:glycine glycyltransferase (peptidoglycan interpeptide bridge formation enzyme)
MSLVVKEVTNKKGWEDFSLHHSPNTFLQSWNWGEFNKALGRKIWRLGVYSNSKLAGICLVLKYNSRLGNYIYCPRGPLFDWKKPNLFKAVFAHLKERAKEEDCIFIKLDPLLQATQENREMFKKLGFKSAVTFVQVEDAWLLPLEKSEEELQPESIKKFVNLLYSTASRKRFTNHPREYYLKQFEIMSKDDQEKIFIAKKAEQVYSMAMIAFYGEMGYYLHAASNPKQAQSVGYSLQWEAIKEAKRRGCKYYNFWGVVKDRNFHSGHPWYGFSLFKRGFGGFKYSYIRAQDYPINAKYYAYRAVERLRGLVNRLQSGHWED